MSLIANRQQMGLIALAWYNNGKVEDSINEGVVKAREFLYLEFVTNILTRNEPQRRWEYFWVESLLICRL